MPYEIAKKLNEFKDLKPDVEWSTRNRELLCSQIGTSHESGFKMSSLWIIFLRVFRDGAFSLKPVYGFILLLSISMGTGIMGLKAVGQAKPGDSLYGTKRVTEKAQLALTFDNQDKASLGIKLASKRMSEMSAVVKTESVPDKKNIQVKNLADDLKREIEAAKSQIAKAYPEATKEADQKIKKADEQLAIVATAKKEEEVDRKEVKKTAELEKKQATSTNKKNVAKKEDGRKDDKEEDEEDETVFIANTAKTEKGMAIGDAKKVDDQKLEDIIKDSQETLEAANESLTKNDYSEALKKLEEAGETLGGIK